MNTLFVGSVQPGSTDDGPGERTVVHLAGCSIRCPGCLNPALWSQDPGQELTARDLVDSLNGCRNKKVTLMGGEPFDQPDGLSELCCLLKTGGFHIVLYSGHPLDYPAALPNGKIVLSLAQMLGRHEQILAILNHCDVLVDGPYLAHLRSDRLAYRGSSNQRVIDLPQTLSKGTLHDPVLLDWDNMLVMTPGGLMIGPPGIMNDAGVGEPAMSSRHCGQLEGGCRREAHSMQTRKR